MNALPPCVLHEDDDLLVLDKPPGWNTHAPAPYSGEGVYEWLHNREPRWSTLAIVHRLDKDTSGVLVFGKTPLANRSLTEQFAGRDVEKRYVFLTGSSPKDDAWTVSSNLVRSGNRYRSRAGNAGDRAETRFEVMQRQRGRTLIAARPLTGRTHQIRVHAAESGVPVLGDSLYGGAASARVCLHAEELTLRHPATDITMSFHAPADFSVDPSTLLRAAVVNPAETDCFRLIHGASDGEPGWRVDKLGGFLLSQSDTPLGDARRARLEALLKRFGMRGAYHKQLDRRVRESGIEQSSPQLVIGDPAPARFIVRENGVSYELSFTEGYSVGIFLDQRDNRRRFLRGHVGADFPFSPAGMEVLNVFAYTCSFAVCAALAGARTTSLDLSKKYLAWGARNLAENGLDVAEHDFIFGDAFDWLRRLGKRQRRFDVIVLDPPTFSQSKQSGVFRAETDYHRLVTAALPLLQPDGVLLTSTNAATLTPEAFVRTLTGAIEENGRRVLKQLFVPQPPDFPVSPREPAYLKTCWWQVA